MTPQLKLRLPEDLKKRVEEASADNRRSLNAEIVQRLESTFFAPPLRRELEKFKDDLKPRDLFEENLMVAWRCLDEPNKEAVLQIVKVMAEYDCGMRREDD
ncbi:Arc family DNA-binding protein [Acetobacter sp. A11-2]|uniref:Arc family DNA-binding protein n=1 Tax=Acetobacter sp. A11-2 TaxID=3157859 RepID=UPI0032EF4AC0